ncbi:hypothetical protein GCM10028774_08780 [Spirosoma jeollabukense]
MLFWLIGCKGKEENTARPATTHDIYGTWTASGLAFESGGEGSKPLTNVQLSLFDNFKAASYTFNIDGSYIKRSLDSTVSSTTVLTTLERGTFKLMNGQLILTTQDLLIKANRNQYYNCDFVSTSLGSFVVYTLSLQATKEQLLKALDEQKQANPSYQQTRDFLLERYMFKVNQTLRQ